MMRKMLLGAFAIVLTTASAFAEKEGDIVLEPIAKDVWIHKSWKTIKPWGPILSQGLVFTLRDEVWLIDTAWTDDQTRDLLDVVEAELGRSVTNAFVTHAHDDKMGGVAALHERNIATAAHPYTNEDAPKRGLTATHRDFMSPSPHSGVVILDGKNELGALKNVASFMYPGPGHSRDNTVVYLFDTRILFAGCLIQRRGSTTLGNTADGDINHWAAAVRNVAEAYPNAEVIIPSHGPPGGRDLLEHTISLAQTARAIRARDAAGKNE